MSQFADSLPIQVLRDALTNALTDGNAAVVTAPTGSGKSTRVPVYLFEDCDIRGRILVLQPRRLAARMLAERVARGFGESPGGTVGYQTRHERQVSADTRILFITEGLLLRFLLADPLLRGTGAVVFDEFHERSLDGDLGLAAVRDLVSQRRSDLKVVVMSATLAAEPVCEYLGGCPHLHADGRLHPVETSFVKRTGKGEIWDSAALAVREVVADGAPGDILVFMPGVYEIRRTEEACRSLGMGERLEIVPLYGDLPPDRQDAAMRPCELRKVIVATNIAETSLTIPGVRHVVDSGLARINRYDAGRGVNMLELAPISRDSAKQRAGRAGREAPGTCRRLWSLAEEHRKPERTAPEVQRVDLAQAIVTIKSLGYGNLQGFPWFEKPEADSLARAEELLILLGILDAGGETLTELGRKAARIPAHPRFALLMTLADEVDSFGDAALAAAILSERPVTLRGKQQTKALRKAAAEDDSSLQSDFHVLIDLLYQARRARFDRGACEDLGIHGGAARTVWRTADFFLQAGKRLGFRTEAQTHDPEPLLRCLLHAFPDRLARRRDAGTLQCDLRDGRKGELAPECTVRNETFLIAGQIREVAQKGKRPRVQISLASGVRELWLLDDFSSAWDETDETVWDERKRQVVRHRRLACLGVVLEDDDSAQVDSDIAARMLADRVADGRLRLDGWNKDVTNWIDRVRWVAEQFPERTLPIYDDAMLQRIHIDLCHGATRYRDIRTKKCLDTVRHVLEWDDIQFVETMAPPAIKLPCGRRMRIEYRLGLPPKGKSRIQDFYDVKQSPRVAGGRVSVLLEILAPNMRTVQITDDLERFWQEHYPRLRKELARRYPKHEWR